MALALRLSQRTKLLLDLEGEARLNRGAPSERCTPSRLIDEAVEKAYRSRWVRTPSALRPDEERRLRERRAALGLTPPRLELLIHGLRLEAFRIGALGRVAGLAGAQPASVALRSLHARGLIRLRRLGPWRMSLWCAERGAELDRWLQPEAGLGPRLQAAEERRLRRMGRALGLSSARIELLVYSLKAESFKPSALSAVPGLTRTGAGAALKRLHARRFIRLQKLGKWPISEWRAEKGEALERALAPTGRMPTGTLRVDEEHQLRRNALALGLRPRRLELMIHSLKRTSFEFPELARSAGMTDQGARQGLADLQKRGLIRLHRLPGRVGAWRAERGESLKPWLR